VRRLRRRAAALRDEGRSVLRAPERLASVAKLQEYAESPRDAARGPAVAAAAPALVRDAAAAVFEQGRTLDGGSPPAALHELRILLKRLRYSAECFTGVYGRDLAR